MNCMESASDSCPPSFSGLHQVLLEKTCRARKLKYLECSRDAGRQRLPEGSKLHTYTTHDVHLQKGVLEAMKYDTLLPLGITNQPKSSPLIQRAGTQLLPTADCGAALDASIRPLSHRTPWKTIVVLWEAVTTYQHNSKTSALMSFGPNSRVITHWCPLQQLLV